MIKNSKSPKIMQRLFPIMEARSNQRFSDKSVKSGFNCSPSPTKSTTIILTKTRLSKATIQLTTIPKKRWIIFSQMVSIILKTFRLFRLKSISSPIQIHTHQIRLWNKKIISWWPTTIKELKIMGKKLKEDEVMRLKTQELTLRKAIDAEPKVTLCIWTIFRFVRLYTKIQIKSLSQSLYQRTSRRNLIQWLKSDTSKRKRNSKTTFTS